MIQAARELGRRIPADLSLVAMTSPRQAETFTPSLTTMDFPAAEMGRLGAELLIRQLRRKEVKSEPIHRLLRAELTVRQSSGTGSGTQLEQRVGTQSESEGYQDTTGGATTSAGVQR